MDFGWAGLVEMQDLVSVCHQPIRNQHAMATKVQAFGTHKGGPRSLDRREQYAHAFLELGGKHVIGVVAKAEAAQTQIEGRLRCATAATAKFLHPYVADPFGRERPRERLSVEMWITT